MTPRECAGASEGVTYGRSSAHRAVSCAAGAAGVGCGREKNNVNVTPKHA